MDIGVTAGSSTSPDAGFHTGRVVRNCVRTCTMRREKTNITIPDTSGYYSETFSGTLKRINSVSTKRSTEHKQRSQKFDWDVIVAAARHIARCSIEKRKLPLSSISPSTAAVSRATASASVGSAAARHVLFVVATDLA